MRTFGWRGRAIALTMIAAGAGVWAGVGAAEPAAAPQRVVIESSERQTTPVAGAEFAGPFVLTVITAGDLASDRGSTRSSVTVDSSGMRDGQRFETITVTSTLTARAGTLVIRGRETTVQVAGDTYVATGTWSVVRGTGPYEGVKGGGRYASVILTRAVASGRTRYEGFLRV